MEYGVASGLSLKIVLRNSCQCSFLPKHHRESDKQILTSRRTAINKFRILPALHRRHWLSNLRACYCALQLFCDTMTPRGRLVLPIALPFSARKSFKFCTLRYPYAHYHTSDYRDSMAELLFYVTFSTTTGQRSILVCVFFFLRGKGCSISDTLWRRNSPGLC